jgi:two-component system, response regulator RegA
VFEPQSEPESLGNRHILLVDDDELFLRAVARSLEARGEQVERASTVQEGLDALARHPRIVLVDVRFPERNGIEIVEAGLQQRPAPIMIAVSGEASTVEAFRLAQLGVKGYLTKPVSTEELISVIEHAASDPANIDLQLTAAVGNTPIHQVQERVRRVMLEQALALTGFNITAAARLLGISRQAVQHMTRDLGLRTSR